MNTPRRIMMLLLLAGATSSCDGPQTVRGPARSALDACVIALAPSGERDDADRDIARLQQVARDEQKTRLALEQLAYRFVARARARHDDGDYLLAARTAECLASKYPDDAAALLLRGHALHQMHRFGEAEQVARRLVARRGMPLDYGLLGDALLEQGRTSEAADAYQKMMDLKPFYQSYTRGAHLRWLRGDLDGAARLIRTAIGSASPRDPESIAWAYTRLAWYELQRGRLEDATRAVDGALAHQEDYPAALLLRGRMLTAMRRLDQGREALGKAAQLNPLPEYQWALADTLRLAGEERAAQHVEQRLTADGVRSDPRTLALFLATRRHDTARAIALAQAEMTVRQDVFTLDALAWSLAAAGRVDEAAPLMSRALGEGTEDARLFLHAGVIAGTRGRRTEARQWAAKAQAMSATLLPSELDDLDTLRRSLSTQQEN